MTGLLLFIFLGLFSPGPNVILLTTSGARFGFSRTLPHLLGVPVGTGITAFLTGLGLGSAIEAMPVLRAGLVVAAAVWILWLAWKLWIAKPITPAATDRPFTFVEAVLFQWVNPKIWAVALAALVQVPEATPFVQASILGMSFFSINLGVCLFWTYAGSLLSVLLTDPNRWRVFMRTMAVALAAFSGLVFL